MCYEHKLKLLQEERSDIVTHLEATQGFGYDLTDYPETAKMQQRLIEIEAELERLDVDGKPTFE